jgi:hypothetical protein
MTSNHLKNVGINQINTLMLHIDAISIKTLKNQIYTPWLSNDLNYLRNAVFISNSCISISKVVFNATLQLTILKNVSPKSYYMITKENKKTNVGR